MFDVSFVELLLIGVVALLVLGPERLPAAARTAGTFLRRARASWQSVQGEFTRELEAGELKRTIGEVRRELDVEAPWKGLAQELSRDYDAIEAPPPPIDPPTRPPHD